MSTNEEIPGLPGSLLLLGGGIPKPLTLFSLGNMLPILRT
jgi:hypothetical protein